MKIKRFILPGILLILAGIFCFTAVLWKHGWDPMRLTSTKYTGRVAKYENVQTIYIEDCNSPIFIKSYGGDSVQIEYAESDSSWYDVQYDGENLRLIKRKQRGFQLFKFDFYWPNVFVSVPENFEGPVIVRTTNGHIEATNLTAEKISLSTSNGSIQVKGAACRLLESYNSNGSLHFENVLASESFTVTDSNGSIRLEKLDSPEIHVKTSNGSVKGTIAGKEADYNIDFDTSNGFGSRTADNGAEKNITVYSSNGSIDLAFAE